jgi:KDO2-lipid IV(A) lauroyltransferase
MTTYTGGLKNILVDDLINTRRRASGLDTVPRFPNGARGLLRALKRKRITGLVADQHESTKRHYVAFFGQPVSVAPGPYQLARHSGAPVVFASGVRVGPFRYRVNIETLPPPNPEGDEELDLLEFTQRAFALLERDVRAHPEQYFWMHRRFRPIPAEVELTPVNRRFLEGRLSGPIDAFWEHAAQA